MFTYALIFVCIPLVDGDPPGGAIHNLTTEIEGDDSEYIGSLAVSFIQRQKEAGRPFFLYLPWHTGRLMSVMSLLSFNTNRTMRCAL